MFGRRMRAWTRWWSWSLTWCGPGWALGGSWACWRWRGWARPGWSWAAGRLSSSPSSTPTTGTPSSAGPAVWTDQGSWSLKTWPGLTGRCGGSWGSSWCGSRLSTRPPSASWRRQLCSWTRGCLSGAWRRAEWWSRPSSPSPPPRPPPCPGWMFRTDVPTNWGSRSSGRRSRSMNKYEMFNSKIGFYGEVLFKSIFSYFCLSII